MPASAVIELRPDAGEAEPRDAVGRTVVRGDQPAPLQAQEYAQRTVAQAVAVAIVAIRRHEAAVLSRMFDMAALRQHVQDALLQFRDVHGNRLSSTPDSAKPAARAKARARNPRCVARAKRAVSR